MLAQRKQKDLPNGRSLLEEIEHHFGSIQLLCPSGDQFLLVVPAVQLSPELRRQASREQQAREQRGG